MRQIVVIASLLLVGCLPAHLQKYRRKSGQIPRSTQNAVRPGEQPKVTRSSSRNSRRPNIYAVDEQTFRFARSRDEVWNAAIDVLLRNYNLNIVDERSGVVTTEWDTFYLNESVYRNKISLRVSHSGHRQVDVMIHNSVEKLQEGGVGGLWLPADELNNERARLVQNMAVVLNEPPPVLPSNNDAVARGQP